MPKQADAEESHTLIIFRSPSFADGQEWAHATKDLSTSNNKTTESVKKKNHNPGWEIGAFKGIELRWNYLRDEKLLSICC